MIYLDSAALVKLVREEDETHTLVDWLNERAGQRLVASVLVDVEVPRALHRSQPEILGAVSATLARIDRIELDAAIRATAAAYADPRLRSLAAIHLATADQLVASGKDVSAFVTYDRHLAEAARASSFPVVAPGAVG
ncbi:MAG: type II toxin-antitoxin system VapC family toxin [Pseudonocardia sp.]